MHKFLYSTAPYSCFVSPSCSSFSFLAPCITLSTALHRIATSFTFLFFPLFPRTLHYLLYSTAPHCYFLHVLVLPSLPSHLALLSLQHCTAMLFPSRSCSSLSFLAPCITFSTALHRNAISFLHVLVLPSFSLAPCITFSTALPFIAISFSFTFFPLFSRVVFALLPFSLVGLLSLQSFESHLLFQLFLSPHSHPLSPPPETRDPHGRAPRKPRLSERDPCSEKCSEDTKERNHSEESDRARELKKQKDYVVIAQ
jgi:hypothetical protein